MNRNPIYLAFYPHTKCKCYKVNNPWTAFHTETIVLCTEEEGLEMARLLAKQVLTQRMIDALNLDLPKEDEGD